VETPFLEMAERAQSLQANSLVLGGVAGGGSGFISLDCYPNPVDKVRSASHHLSYLGRFNRDDHIASEHTPALFTGALKCNYYFSLV
jgi:hypothetical protein